MITLKLILLLNLLILLNLLNLLGLLNLRPMIVNFFNPWVDWIWWLNDCELIFFHCSRGRNAIYYIRQSHPNLFMQRIKNPSMPEFENPSKSKNILKIHPNICWKQIKTMLFGKPWVSWTREGPTGNAAHASSEGLASNTPKWDMFHHHPIKTCSKKSAAKKNQVKPKDHHKVLMHRLEVQNHLLHIHCNASIGHQFQPRLMKQ